MNLIRPAILFLLLASTLHLSCREREASPVSVHNGYQLFLLIGQSNMAGRGVVVAEDTVADSRVMMLNKDSAWVPAVEPLHFDKPIAGVGPGRAFGLAVAERNPAVTIGLIPAAVGGSSILTWEPGAHDSATDTHPYDDAMARARKAMESGTLAAVLWHQGESDSNADRAPQYKQRLATLITRLREEFGDPDLPFLIGQLGRFDENPWNEWRQEVNDAHVELANEVDEVYFVSSDGLGDKGDGIHFSASAARELGRRYADAYSEHQRSAPVK